MSTTPQNPASAKSSALTTTTNEPLLVVDIGKRQSKKRIKNLRQGRGKLFDKVLQTIGELKADGTIDDKVKPIVIVVRQREAASGFGFLK